MRGQLDRVVHISRAQLGVATSAKSFVTDNPSILSLYSHTKGTILHNLEWSDVICVVSTQISKIQIEQTYIGWHNSQQSCLRYLHNQGRRHT